MSPFGQQPVGSQPMVPQPGEPFTTAPVGGRRAGLIGVGALLLASGLVTGIVLFLASSSNYDEGVRNLARAPIGCTTSLEFDEAGTYTIYVETRGTIGDLRGDCPNADAEFDLGDSDVPEVDIVLVDGRGDEIDLDDDDSKDYDAAGFAGQSVSSVEISDAGDYEITATSDENELAIAIGRNPKDTAGSMKSMAILALALGVVLGGLCLVLGMRRRPAPGVGAPPNTQMAGPLPMGGPVAGPTGAGPNPSQPPAYQPPQPAPPYQPPAAPQLPPMPPAPPMPPKPPAPPAPPAGGPSWPAPPGA